jgi:hypothetical protein
MHRYEVAMSDDIESRLRMLDGRIANVQAEARACVEELLVDDGARHLVAERLPGLGSAILPSIHDLLRNPSTQPDVRTLAAIAGFDVGDRFETVEILLDEVATLSDFAALAARRLAAARVSGAAERMLEGLQNPELVDVDLIVVYLEALHDLGTVIDERVQARLRGVGAWQIDTALRQWHPASQES